MEWTKEWPEEEGWYWFYGYRYGRESCGSKNNPEYMMMKCWKVSNGYMMVGDGSFVHKSETEEAYFLKITPPKQPEDFKK